MSVDDEVRELADATEEARSSLYFAAMHFMSTDDYSGIVKLVALQSALLISAARVAMVIQDKNVGSMTKARFGRLARDYYADEMPNKPRKASKPKAPVLKIIK